MLKPFKMDLYSLIRYLPISTNRFTKKMCYFFYFFRILWNKKRVKTSDKMLIVDRIMNIFLWSKFFLASLALPAFKIFSRAPMPHANLLHIWRTYFWRKAMEFAFVNISCVQVNCKFCLHRLKWTNLKLQTFL